MWLNFFRRRTQKARPERGDGDMKREDVKRVLFVCTGNICRSPTAEGIALRRIAELGLEGWVEVDSAGTTGYHAGELPDQRARKAAAGRGYDLDALRARQLEVRDFQEFDLVLALDAGHLAHMRRKSPPVYHTKIRLLMEFARSYPDVSEVPDPYYGGPAGFEQVLDYCEDAVEGILAWLNAPPRQP